jgi:hypothetical protein
MQHSRAARDRATWDAYGWPEDKEGTEVEKNVIFSCRAQLPALNGERAEAA